MGDIIVLQGQIVPVLGMVEQCGKERVKQETSDKERCLNPSNDRYFENRIKNV